MIWALVLTLLQAEDPRPNLVQLQLEGKIETALVAVEVALESHSDEARRLGFDYLQGHLLEAVGRRLDAHQAFVNAMGANPELRDYSRYRLAWNQYRLGHPEVAAGLLATLLAGDPPESLAPAATRLLVRSLAMGGDCRLLGGVQTWRLARRERRLVELAVADCAARLGDSRRARRLLLGLLEEGVNDDTARAAAERLVSLTSPTSSPPSTTLLLGLALHHHRDFEQATRFLEEGLATAPLEIPGQPEAERQQARFALARSYFWRGNYSAAAQRFGELAERGRKTEERARALYQQGRCYELDGDWAAASQSYRQVQQADLAGRWTAPALLSALRVEFRSGNENATLELLAHLKSRRQWRDMMARGALFLAASDLVRSRSDRAGSWLALAGRGRGSVPVEVAYWRGRLAETQEQPIAAARWYLAALLPDLYHPLSQEARQRLASTPLAESAHSEGLRLAASENNRDLYGAWLLLGEADATGQAARRHLEKHLGQRSRSRDFLEMEVVPPQEWPLWQGPLRQPEELLLALGILEEGTSVIQHHFPVSQVSLGFTGSRVLARAGLTRPSLRQAEILLRRVPNDLPLELLPVGYQQLLYPLPYRNLILQQAQRFDVDPMLLAAIIREESRFDPLAVSAASARGLTQFVLPTAKRLISELQIERLEAEDLHRPEISIALGAAYLAELENRYAGDQFQMIAAYNAGEDQARVWRSYCYSREPAEYYSKVGFSQTREYLRNVLSSRARYQDLHGSTSE